MRRAVHLATAVFWTAAPLLAVLLAVPSPRAFPEWPAVCLWLVVAASSAFLTLDAFPVETGGPEERVRRGRPPEAAVYPVAFALSSSLFAFQLLP